MDNLDFNYFCKSCTKDEAYRKANCFTRYRVREYKKGDIIASRGEKAMELSIVYEGSVKTEIILDSGIPYTTQYHSSPYTIGALAIFATDNHYRADFIACGGCTTISVSRDDIELQMTQCRTFLRNFIAYNTSKFDLLTQHITVLTQKSIKAKLVFYILSITKNQRFKFDKRIDELAIYMCVERPSLSRAISQLANEGLIEYNRGEGKIIDIVALKNILG